MKKSELVFSALLVPIDFMMLVGAGLLTYYIRFTAFTDVRPVQEVIALGKYFNGILIVAAVWVAIFAISGLYAIRSTQRALDEAAKVFLGCSTGILLVIVAIFFQRELFSSRFVVLVGWFLALIGIIVERAVIRAIQHGLLRKGVGAHAVVIVGADETTNDIVGFLSSHPAVGYRVVERFERVDAATFDRLIERMRASRIDEIIQTDASIPKEDTRRLMDFCNERHLTYRYAADLYDARSTNIDIQTLAGIPIIELRRTRLDGWGKILKRGVDVLASSLGLIILSPLFLITGLLVKLDSAGPIFMGLERVGEGGRAFRVWKFRSMIRNAEALKAQLMDKNERDGPLFKIKNDPRITRVGRFLRKTSLDELPQLWNILHGEMSLVGPRPHEPGEVACYEKHHKKVLSIKPGLTGMAQVSGRSDLSFEEEVRLDTYYIENWSLRLDLQILLKTPFVVFTMRSAV